jgi:hypothetical protein
MGRGKTPLTTRTPGVRWLRQQLKRAAAAHHPRPRSLRRDRALFNGALALYGEAPREVWVEHVEPFLGANGDEIDALYRSTPRHELLDLIEAPMILERLAADRRRVERLWPAERASLRSLGQTKDVG